MTRRLNWPLWLLLFLLFELPAASCGPDWPDAVFVKQYGPDAPYAAFVKGRVGVPQPGYRTRHLVIVYNYLTGRILSADEQAQAIATNKELVDSWADLPENGKVVLPGYDAWIKARGSFGAVDGYIPDGALANERLAMYWSIPNCLDDAFATAARTLMARAKVHGPKSAEVVEWVRGQDAVFTNCKEAAKLPAAAPSAILWLRQDRAYQIAAAEFYALRYDRAIADFRKIAADTTSPWSIVSHYLVARTMIRRATDLVDENDGQAPGQGAAHEKSLAALSEAQHELLALQTEPRMAPLAQPISNMLDLVNARLQPEVQANVLSSRLSGSHDARFRQDLIDLAYIRNAIEEKAQGSPGKTPTVRPSEMMQWIDAVNQQDTALSLKQWHATHKNLWLLAALMSLEPNPPVPTDLLQAAKAVPMSDPAYVAITYQRLRLMPFTPESRADLLAVLPGIEQHEGPSTKNLFAALNASSAPDLETWLKVAGRPPAAESTVSEDDEFDPKPSPRPCGPDLADAATPLFTPEAAKLFNQKLSLKTLATAAESKTLAPNLRFQLAQAVWTRAVLFNESDIAHRMSSILIGCRSEWKPVLDEYDNAATPRDRKANGLLALMRFASTNVNVRAGNERIDGFATYSYFRDNWWCQTSPSYERNFRNYEPYGEDTRKKQPPDPLFLNTLNSDDRYGSETDNSYALSKIPNAANYFATQALVWQKSFPADPRTPEILGQALRVVRNGCYNETTPQLGHLLFLSLQLDYPDSPWAKHYTTWDAH